MIDNKPAFIRDNTRLLPVPHAPEIVLHVADDSTALWHKTEEELGEMGLPPPFWAFAWAGGQALARYILDNPAIVCGKSVLDFASGSGLVAIAAMKAGASSALAADIDPFTPDAIGLNAHANGVSVTPCCADLIGQDQGWDIILAGDVCYQRDMTDAVLGWLRPFAAKGRPVLLGDPGRSYFPKEGTEKLAEYMVPVTQDLEDMEIKRTSVWQLL